MDIEEGKRLARKVRDGPRYKANHDWLMWLAGNGPAMIARIEELEAKLEDAQRIGPMPGPKDVEDAYYIGLAEGRP